MILLQRGSKATGKIRLSMKGLWHRGISHRVSKAARTLILFCDQLNEILEWYHTVAPHHNWQCTTSESVHCDKQEEDNNEAASPQQLSIAPHKCSEDLLSSGALFLSPIAEPGTQDTQEADLGQDEDKSNGMDIKN